ncbi:hypothetical protein [Poseidonibacter ostreae]|uniref:Uncharacterized protein n=1 Tax=Poseidonibacter ostreae TaxID=2654171 RepID=A0A6L4WR86_9BACT|nr:hypothetical protein [Poseidonibacter ostreae]KAB7887419.1 hypothetical protein GBG19_10700 [Poseidonibacter ostreae]
MVDDVILVLNRFGQIKNANDIIDFLETEVNSINIMGLVKEKEAFQYKTLYFKNSKQKIFYFDKDSDLSTLKAMKKEHLK